jgi:hypothetical protein
VVAATNDYTWAQINKTTSSIADITTKTHSLLGSLTADDHTQYTLLAGRSGGQTLIGGTASGNNLVLQSTSHATKGQTQIGATLYVDEVNGRVGIGTASPGVAFHMSDGTTPASALFSGTTGFVYSGGSASAIAGMVANNSVTARPLFKAIRAKGTLDAPTAVEENNYLMSFLAAGYDGSALQIPATIDIYVDGSVSSGSVPARISFVTGTNATDRAERLTIKNTGNLGIGTTAPTYLLSLGGNSARTFWMERHSTSNTAGNTLTIQAGGATSGATDKAGGDLLLYPGVSTGSAESGIQLYGCVAGASGTVDRTQTKMLQILGNKIGLFGVTPVVRPSAYTITNGTTDRTYDANATTIDELADVIYTIIADLQSLGLLQ